MKTAPEAWPIWLRALQVLGAAWASPNSLLGLIGGLAGMLGGDENDSALSRAAREATGHPA